MVDASGATETTDPRGASAVPGLIHNHLHIIRGGLITNLALQWDGMCATAETRAMLNRQVAVTPPQRAWAIGGYGLAASPGPDEPL